MWGYWEMMCCSCKTKEHQQQENQITKIQKQTTKQENEIANTQTKNKIKT